MFKYLLGQVSSNRVVDLRDDMKRAFDRVKNEVVLKVITQNSGLDVKIL